MLNDLLWNIQITGKNKLQKYNLIEESTITHGAEKWKFSKNIKSKLMSMETDFFLGNRRDALDYIYTTPWLMELVGSRDKPPNSWAQEVTTGIREKVINTIEWIDKEEWIRKVQLQF